MEAITPDGANPLYPTPPILPAPTKARNQTGFKNRAVLSESDRCHGLWTPGRREQRNNIIQLTLSGTGYITHLKLHFRMLI